MKQRQLGSSGLYVSDLGLGTMTWGRETDEDDASSQLRTYVEAGGTLIDTADVYVDGESERIVGRLIGDVVARDNIVLATKAVFRRDNPRGRDASRGHLLSALDASLARLGTDHIDLWQLHHWDAKTPMEESLAALDLAVSSGRVRYVGVSNYCGWQTAAAATWQRAWPGRAPIVSTQVEYSMLERGVEREVIPAAVDLGIGVLPWSPLGRGVLTGKYQSGTPSDSRANSSFFGQWVSQFLDERSTGIVGALMTAADGLGASPVAVALAWIRDRPGVTAPIIGARTNSQLRGSLEADSTVLPEEIRSALDDVSAPYLSYPEALTTPGR